MSFLIMKLLIPTESSTELSSFTLNGRLEPPLTFASLLAPFSLSLTPLLIQVLLPRFLLRGIRFPHPFMHKLNFDGSVLPSSAVAGIIIRDHQGKTLQEVAYNLGSTQVHIAEAASLQQGILQARQLNLNNL